MKQFTVKINREGIIVNKLDTDNYSEALRCEEDMVKQYGKDNVWICDNLQEILVG